MNLMKAIIDKADWLSKNSQNANFVEVNEQFMEDLKSQSAEAYDTLINGKWEANNIPEHLKPYFKFTKRGIEYNYNRHMKDIGNSSNR